MHDKTEYEFAAKTVLDVCKQKIGEDKGYICFVADMGEGGHIGYLSNIRREDAIAAIIEWLVYAMEVITHDQIIDILKNLDKIKDKA